MPDDEKLLVTFQRLTDAASTLRRTTDDSRAVTIARFQQMEAHFALSATLLPPLHEQASRYLHAIRERYLTFLTTYGDIADQLDATAQNAGWVHTGTVHALGDVHEQ